MFTTIPKKPWYVYTKAFLIFFLFSVSHAQNSRQERLSSKSIQTVVIKGNQIFNIDISTHNTSEILLNSRIDGEYQDFYQITKQIKGTTLVLQLEENPMASIPDDKRNAHKVIAASLTMIVPEHMNLDIASDIASVNITGDFNRFTIQLLEGFCKINGRVQTGIVNTVNGNIYVRTSNGQIKANSRYGAVSIDSLSLKKSTWRLNSIRGDIKVSKQN